MNWQEQLRTEGYAHFVGLIPEPLVTAAHKAIELDLRANYDPLRQSEYDNQSYCPDLKGTSPIMDLLVKSAARIFLTGRLREILPGARAARDE